MLYQIVKPIIKIAVRVFFRKIYFHQATQLNADRPMIFACNHPSGFIEPLILCTHLPFPLHSITRGDMFQKPFYRKILESLYMIPIFRFKDGYSNLKNNQATLEHCYKVLSQNKTILIFAEGQTKWEKRLRPIQKGTARMVFGTNDLYQNEEILVVPIGINYSNILKFRSDVMVSIGEPIAMKDYLTTYQENNNKAITKMTADISTAMAAETIIIEKEEDEPLVEYLFELHKNDLPEGILPILVPTKDRLLEEKFIANEINNMPESEKAFFQAKIEGYFEQLSDLKITDFAVVNPGSNLILGALVLIIGFLPALIGKIINYLPYTIGKRIADKRVKNVEFYAPVAMAVGMGIYLIQGLVLLTTLLLLLGWQGIFWVAMIPIWSYFELVYTEYFDRLKQHFAIRKLSADQLMAIRKTRFSLTSKFNEQKDLSV